MNEKKFHEMLENEKRMYSEIEILKNERDRHFDENADTLEIERQSWKQKFTELEDRLRE